MPAVGTLELEWVQRFHTTVEHKAFGTIDTETLSGLSGLKFRPRYVCIFRGGPIVLDPAVTRVALLLDQNI
jgi:hypothetical protein